MKVESFGDLFDGYYDDSVYFHTPTHFLPGLGGDWRLDRLRESDIILTIGDADPFLDNNRYLSRLLADKNVGHQLHVGDPPCHQRRVGDDHDTHICGLSIHCGRCSPR